MRATPESSAELAEEIYRLVCQSRRALVLTTTHALEAQQQSIFTWQVVSWIVRNGPTTQRDLSYVLAQHPAGISRQVDELESEGLVRRRSVSDRRRLLVEATPKGKRWFQATSADVMEAVDRALDGLSTPQRRELRGLLRQLLEAMGGHGLGSGEPFPTRRTGRAGRGPTTAQTAQKPPSEQ